MKKERSTMDGEDRERKMIEDQIARARAAAGAEEVQEKGLEKTEGVKISLSLFPKPAEAGPSQPSETKDGEGSTSLAPAAAAASKPALSFGGFGKTPVANPLKRPAAGNVFKSAKVAKTDSEKPKAFVSEAERLMKEDLARKSSRGGYSGAGPRRGEARR